MLSERYTVRLNRIAGSASLGRGELRGSALAFPAVPAVREGCRTPPGSLGHAGVPWSTVRGALSTTFATCQVVDTASRSFGVHTAGECFRIEL